MTLRGAREERIVWLAAGFVAARARERDCRKDATLRTAFRFRSGTNVALCVESPGPVCLDEGVAAWIVVGMDATTRKGT